MSGIKKLAGQTLWYGASSIVAKFLNYLLTPYLTLKFSGADYGEMSVTYAAIPFLNVIFTYGMETAYFRFSSTDKKQKDVFNTSAVSLIASTVLLTTLLIFFSADVAGLLKIQHHPEYISIAAFIIAFDALSAIPFARLRLDGRPVKYAAVRVGGILVNIFSLYFFISILPALAKNNTGGLFNLLYVPNWEVGYVLVANLLQAVFTLLFLFREFSGFQFRFNKALWKEMVIYAFPLTIAGFAGMINETFDRIMLQWWAPAATDAMAKEQVGTYSACYKLAILITLGVQAFRMGAEPFFFKQAGSQNAPQVYARVMKFFVVTLSVMFLIVMLYLDIWKYFIQNEKMWEGLKIVPVLLFANIFLGIYYNLSIWYKLGKKTTAGAYITIIGAAITVAVNYFFIPVYGYMACAWATFACYAAMMVISYVWGQKNYPVPYNLKKIGGYLIFAWATYLLHKTLAAFYPEEWFSLLLATILFLIYIGSIVAIEKDELAKLPFMSKISRRL